MIQGLTLAHRTEIAIELARVRGILPENFSRRRWTDQLDELAFWLRVGEWMERRAR